MEVQFTRFLSAIKSSFSTSGMYLIGKQAAAAEHSDAVMTDTLPGDLISLSHQSIRQLLFVAILSHLSTSPTSLRRNKQTNSSVRN
jgi:hypothetical protein